MSEQRTPTPPGAPPASETDDLARSARRGALFIPIAKGWFLIAGMLLQILLPRALGSMALFGVWTLVQSWLSPIGNVINTATIQAVAHFAAAGGDAVERAKRTALKMNALTGCAVAALLFLGAPLIAWFEHDPELVPYLRVGSILILAYSFYSVFVGSVNGARLFHKQAALDIAFSATRVGLMLGLAAATKAVMPALSGWVLTGVLMLGVSVLVAGPPRKTPGDELPVATMRLYIGWLVPFLVALNVLIFLDGWWLKRLYTEALASATRLGPAEIKSTVDAVVGAYGAAQTIARLPYQLIVAVAFVVFPVLSAPAVQADPERTRSYITATLRYSLVASIAMVAAMGVRPEATLRLLYKPEYVTGTPALSVLLAAYACFSLFSIVGTITNSLGRTIQTALLGLSTVLFTCGSVYLAIQRALAAGQQPLRAAALGLLVGMAVGLGLSLIYLWSAFRATLPPLSILRVGLGLAVALALGRVWPQVGTPGLLGGKVGTVLCAGLAGLVFLLVQFVTRELSLRELLMVRRGRPKLDGSPQVG
jgi:O-antigen/teichoic acid export membrane protein